MHSRIIRGIIPYEAPEFPEKHGIFTPFVGMIVAFALLKNQSTGGMHE